MRDAASAIRFQTHCFGNCVICSSDVSGKVSGIIFNRADVNFSVHVCKGSINPQLNFSCRGASSEVFLFALRWQLARIFVNQ